MWFTTAVWIQMATSWNYVTIYVYINLKWFEPGGRGSCLRHLQFPWLQGRLRDRHRRKQGYVAAQESQVQRHGLQDQKIQKARKIRTRTFGIRITHWKALKGSDPCARELCGIAEEGKPELVSFQIHGFMSLTGKFRSDQIFLSVCMIAHVA